MTLLADLNEPDNAIRLMRQSIDVAVAPLNLMHRSDYFFGNYEGKMFQFSRKQAGELVGNMDEAEAQLADYYPNADVNYQIVEGWISPLPIRGISIVDHTPAQHSIRELGQKVYCYQIQPNGNIERGHSFSAVNISMLYAWIHRLDRVGITTYWTINWVETARLLVVLYKNEQKPPEEHHTLTRIIKPRLTIKKAEPLVKALLYLSDAYEIGIGEVKAKAIADRFCNLIDIATADVAELKQIEGIGDVLAKRLLKSLGRSI